MLEVKHPINVSLFLGAGASAPFDYAPTRPFVKKLRSKLNDDQKGFVDSLLSIDHVKDVEHVIDILNSILELDTKLTKYPMKQVLQKYPLSFDFKSAPKTLMKVVALTADLKDTIEAKLFDEYEPNPPMIEKIVEVYDPFFDLIESHMQTPQAPEVFTTNFDTVIEDYLSRTRRYDLVDGFRNSEWHPEEFQKKDNLKLLRLYKLHGSVDWAQKHDGRIMKVPIVKRIENSRIWKKNIVIYPASKEEPREEPFDTLYTMFRKRIRSKAETCVAIGFSFRDDYINRIIADWLTEVKTAKLVIVSKSAGKSMGNLLQREKRLKIAEKEKRIIPVRGKFGDRKTIEAIKSHLTS